MNCPDPILSQIYSLGYRSMKITSRWVVLFRQDRNLVFCPRDEWDDLILSLDFVRFTTITGRNMTRISGKENGKMINDFVNCIKEWSFILGRYCRISHHNGEKYIDEIDPRADLFYLL